MDAPAVADHEVAERKQLTQRAAFRARKDGVVCRQIQFQFGASAAEGSDVFKLCDFGIL